MIYYVKVKDTEGHWVEVEVSKEVYDCFEQERTQQENQARYDRDFLDKYADMESLPNTLLTDSRLTLEEKTEVKEILEKVEEIIGTCSQKQQRRFYLNRICGFSATEIAQKEICSEGAIRHSISDVEKKIKNFFE